MPEPRKLSRREIADASTELLVALTALHIVTRDRSIRHKPTAASQKHIIEMPSDTHNMIINGMAVSIYAFNPAASGAVLATGAGIWMLSQLAFVPANLRKRKATEIRQRAGKLVMTTILDQKSDAAPDAVVKALEQEMTKPVEQLSQVFGTSSLPELTQKAFEALRQPELELVI